MTPRSRSVWFSILIYCAFFASGAASLIAEVTWNRMLIVVVGNSVSAAAMIIMVFMGGLGFGSHIGGKVFGARRISLLPYLGLELAVGAYVLLSPMLFDFFSGSFTALAGDAGGRAGLTAVRLAVTMGALFIPATLMGATFPAIISGAALDSATGRTARTGYLYSTNTLGAAIGCFVAGYHLLFEYGVQTTLTLACAVYASAAICALAAYWLDRGGPPAETPALAPNAPDSGTKAATQTVSPEAATQTAIPQAAGNTFAVPRSLWLFLAAATFCVGFVSLAYEVLLTRLSILYLGNSVSVFPLVLTSFLLGIGISAIVGTRLFAVFADSERGAREYFAAVAAGAGICVLITPYLLLTDLVMPDAQYARIADSVSHNPLPIIGIIVAPTMLLGALLPIAIRMLQPAGRGEATRGAATLYALNTAGGLLGAGVASHILVPWMGIQGVITLLTLICLGIAIISWMSPSMPAGRWATAAVGIATLAALFSTLPNMTYLYAQKVALSTRAQVTDVKLIHEGRTATVAVIDQIDTAEGSYRDMYLNGVEEASTRYWHTQLFKLLGILPPVTHASDEPKDALVIAFGAGITAGSVLASDQVRSLDVVDLNPDIEGINDLFTDVNGDVFHQPRFHFHNDDGRNYLVTSGKQYDLIISDSTHPRAYDSWILYTTEFYEAVKKRLRDDGIFAQWVPVLGSMQGDLFRIHLNTFRRVFPHTTFWYVYGSDQAFLMATPKRLVYDREKLQQRLDALPTWFKAEHYQIDTVARIAGFFWLDEQAMDRMIGNETRINTDDEHYIGKQSAAWPSPPHLRLPQFQARAHPIFQPMDMQLAAQIKEEQTLARHLANYVFYNSETELVNALCAMPENGNVQFLTSLHFSGRPPNPETLCAARAVHKYRRMLSAHPNDPKMMNALASALGDAGQLPEAHSYALRAVEILPEDGAVRDTLGWIAFRMGRIEEAMEHLKKAAALLPSHPIVLYHLGAVSEAAGQRDSAKRYLEQALQTSTDFIEVESARELLTQIERR